MTTNKNVVRKTSLEALQGWQQACRMRPYVPAPLVFHATAMGKGGSPMVAGLACPHTSRPADTYLQHHVAAYAVCQHYSRWLAWCHDMLLQQLHLVLYLSVEAPHTPLTQVVRVMACAGQNTAQHAISC